MFIGVVTLIIVRYLHLFILIPFSRWLLRDPDMKVRSNYPGYQTYVRSYFFRLIAEISDLQVTISRRVHLPPHVML